jgi:hypothetical protein
LTGFFGLDFPSAKHAGFALLKGLNQMT